MMHAWLYICIYFIVLYYQYNIESYLFFSLWHIYCIHYLFVCIYYIFILHASTMTIKLIVIFIMFGCCLEYCNIIVIFVVSTLHWHIYYVCARVSNDCALQLVLDSLLWAKKARRKPIFNNAWLGNTQWTPEKLNAYKCCSFRRVILFDENAKGF